jgi:hypothetical protein
MVIDKEKPATVRPVGGLKGGGVNSPNHSEAKNTEQAFVLAALRSVSLRVRLINSEIEEVGTALKGGQITPQMALEWAEECAPGCLGYIPETLEAYQVIKKRRESEAA